MKRIYIEITNICNLHCAFCVQNTRKPHDMSVSEFSHVLDEIQDHCRYIYLHVQGEPLRHPEINTFLSVCDERGFHVQLVTNGSLLHQNHFLLDHPSLRKISVSLQSVEYQPNFNADLFMKEIFALIDYTRKNQRPITEIRFWRDDQLNMKNTEACLAILKERYTFSEDRNKTNFKLADNVYVDMSNMFEWPGSNSSSETQGTCHGAIDQLAILSDGTVVPCCLDADGHVPLGNIFSDSMNDILASEKYLSLVDGFRKRQITEPFCRKCTFKNRFQ